MRPDDEPVQVDDKSVHPDEEPVHPDEESVRLDEESVHINEEPVRADEDSVHLDGELVDMDGEAIRADDKSVRLDEDLIRPDEEPVDADGEIVQPNENFTSPASTAFIKLGNAQSRARMGKDLIGETHNLVLSPVVIAMWQPMAEAIGWGRQPVGWSDILTLARDPRGWAIPNGEPFKLGHTHTEYSNSGLISC
jgi:hypothetical protein